MLARRTLIASVAAVARPRVVYAHSLPSARDLSARFDRLNKNDVSRELLELRSDVAAWPAVSEHLSYINACTDRDFLFELSYLAVMRKRPLPPNMRVTTRKSLIQLYERADDKKKEVLISIIGYYQLDASES